MMLNLLQLTPVDKEELLDIFHELIRSVDGDEDACDMLCYLLDNYSGIDNQVYYVCAQVVRDKIVVYLSGDAGMDGYPRGKIYGTESLEIDWVRNMLKEV